MRKNKRTEKQDEDPESESPEKGNNTGVIRSRYLHTPEDESYEVIHSCLAYKFQIGCIVGRFMKHWQNEMQDITDHQFCLQSDHR